MGEEPLHWSERAKLASPSAFPPVSVPRRPPLQPSEKEALQAGAGLQQPAGLMGWLVLPIIGLFEVVVYSIVAIFTRILPTFGNGTFSLLTTPGTKLYDSLWGPFFIFDLFVTGVMIVFPTFLLTLVFRRNSLLPKLIIWFYAFGLVVLFLDSMAILSFSANLREAGGWSTGWVVRNFLEGIPAPAIWIPYFVFSKRVRNTFVR